MRGRARAENNVKKDREEGGEQGRERRRADAPSGAEKISEKSKFRLTIQLICLPTS